MLHLLLGNFEAGWAGREARLKVAGVYPIMDRARAATTAGEYFETTSFLDGANAIYIEQLRDCCHAEPNSVDASRYSRPAALRHGLRTM